ncbi:hypothetical protein NLI96_g9294 [Meripilus lineatus]|uniref:DUF6534 domain-containing protein n=1 Tax=Meripilus lineatus TaxID=2056292 RepID=A0AAD5UXC4_9APHY|nr:hypothetical protein NLI96_g9294 [Physisporinus lineatus]
MQVSEGGKVALIAHGPSLIGIFMNMLLFGIMIMQTSVYFSTYKKDPTWLKIYVAVLFVADLLNSVFNMVWIYDALINNFGNLEALATANWWFQTEEAMAGIIAMLVQFFYAWRILVLTRNYWWVSAILVTSVVSGLSAIGTAIGVGIVKKFIEFQKLEIVAILWLVGTAVCDVLITSALSLHLRKHRTGFSSTDSVLNKIIRITVSNGLLTSALAIADVTAFLASPTGIHIAFNYALVKMYTNSVMSSLNSRQTMVANEVSMGSTINKDGTRVHEISNFVTTNRSLRPQVVVNVETHEMIDVDNPSKVDVEWNDTKRHSPNNSVNAQ